MTAFAKQICACAFVAALVASMGNARATDFRVLYSFCSQANCQDGLEPFAGVTGAGGALYGTTLYGGTSSYGTIFTIQEDGTEAVLYSFCETGFPCPNGAFPFDGLIRDGNGDLYGTTLEGGSDNCPVGGGCGTVFELAVNGSYALLHVFCLQTGCPDGAFPSAGLIRDKAGNIYGTAQYGGGGPSCFGFPYYGCGAVFEVAPDGTETVLHGFCPDGSPPCADGADPFGGLVQDNSGDLYGTTVRGGGTGCGGLGCGVVFKIPQGRKEKVLHSFSGGTDGAAPMSVLILDGAGDLYGTAFQGGGSGCGGSGCGIVFKIAPAGAESVLYRFCGRPKCADGALPYGALIADKQGILYGTTEAGGITNCKLTNHQIKGCGAVFRLAPDGTESVLHNFCSEKACADGQQPTSGLLHGMNGILIGTTNLGGKNGRGTVYKLKE